MKFSVIAVALVALCMLVACANTGTKMGTEASQPIDFNLAVTKQGGVEVSWSPVAGFDQYAIYRNDFFVEKVAGNHYVDDAVMPGTHYAYQVIALRNGKKPPEYIGP